MGSRVVKPSPSPKTSRADPWTSASDNVLPLSVLPVTDGSVRGTSSCWFGSGILWLTRWFPFLGGILWRKKLSENRFLKGNKSNSCRYKVKYCVTSTPFPFSCYPTLYASYLDKRLLIPIIMSWPLVRTRSLNRTLIPVMISHPHLSGN